MTGITQAVLSLLKSKGIAFSGVPPTIQLTCPMRPGHTANIDCPSGYTVCYVCGEGFSFRSLKRRLKAIPTLHKGGVLGLPGVLKGRPSQGEIEGWINRFHSTLEKNCELAEFFVQASGCRPTSLGAFRIGWTGPDFMLEKSQAYCNCYSLPVCSPAGVWLGIYFYGKNVLEHRRFDRFRKWSKPEIFWGLRPDDFDRVLTVENPIAAIAAAEKLEACDKPPAVIFVEGCSLNNKVKDWILKYERGKAHLLDFSKGGDEQWTKKERLTGTS